MSKHKKKKTELESCGYKIPSYLTPLEINWQHNHFICPTKSYPITLPSSVSDIILRFLGLTYLSALQYSTRIDLLDWLKKDIIIHYRPRYHESGYDFHNNNIFIPYTNLYEMYDFLTEQIWMRAVIGRISLSVDIVHGRDCHVDRTDIFLSSIHRLYMSMDINCFGCWTVLRNLSISSSRTNCHLYLHIFISRLNDDKRIPYPHIFSIATDENKRNIPNLSWFHTVRLKIDCPWCIFTPGHEDLTTYGLYNCIAFYSDAVVRVLPPERLDDHLCDLKSILERYYKIMDLSQYRIGFLESKIDLTASFNVHPYHMLVKSWNRYFRQLSVVLKILLSKPYTGRSSSVILPFKMADSHTRFQHILRKNNVLYVSLLRQGNVGMYLVVSPLTGSEFLYSKTSMITQSFLAYHQNAPRMPLQYTLHSILNVVQCIRFPKRQTYCAEGKNYPTQLYERNDFRTKQQFDLYTDTVDIDYDDVIHEFITIPEFETRYFVR